MSRVIAIDAQLSPREAGGSETHVPLQIAALAQRHDERFLILGSVDHAEELEPLLGDNMESLAWPVRYTWFKADVPAPSAAANDALLAAHGARGVHFPYPQHFDTDLPFIYEPWGLPHRHFPQTFQYGEPEWMDHLMRSGCERAAYVLVATHWAKKDIVAAYDLPPQKVAVVSRNPMHGRPTTAEPVEIASLPESFALMPGAAWPHKNHVGMIKAVAALRDRHGVRLDVVCTGKTDTTAWNAIQAALKDHGVEDQVRFLGPIPRAHLEYLFTRARMLLHPSRFEGLGLPLVEAMHYGLPIVASDATCIPEVVGDAALLFESTDMEAFTAALLRAEREPGLLADLAERGRRRLAQDFPTLDQLAERFSTLYAAAVGDKLTAGQKRLLGEMTGGSA